MTAQLLQNGPTISVGQQSQRRDWVILGSARNRDDFTTEMSQTKLLFNEAIPASASNRATYVRLPAPIVIEKLLPLSEERENANSTRSSISFTALSEERLQAAVKLAKRDLRRRHLESLIKSPARPSQEASLLETSDVELLQELATTPSKAKLRASSPKEKAARPGAKQTSQKRPMCAMPRAGQSPPTRDPGPKQLERGKQAPLSQEIHKLQNELEVYIQKVEELANRGEKMEELLEPEEQNKLEVRRQKQAARSARIIYDLQKQVKEIQEDMEKLRSQKLWDTKKSTAVNRLAAAHRGALRALQVVINQLSDLSHSKLPPHYKELGQLIRQLSLCSAKVEVDQGSAVPETALDILQKLETLDSALSKQEMLEKIQAQTCPPHRKSYRSMSPIGVLKGPSTSTVRGPRKPANPKRGVRAGRRMASQKPKTTSHQPMNRRELLRAGLESLAQQRELRELQGQPQMNTTCRKGLHSDRRKADIIMKRNQMRDAGFQQPTVSSRLRVNELPQKEHSVPWIPTSPHSPPQRRSPQRGRPEPRCLFPPMKPSPSPPRQRMASGFGEEPVLSSQKKKQAQNEALRKAWLDKMTMQRLKELNQLSKEEAEHIQRLRSEVVSPTQWAERAEQKARERIQPLLDEAQQIGESRDRISSSLRNRLSEQAAERAAETAEQLSEALLEDLLEDTARAAWAAETDRQLEGMAQRRLQAPTLESMLLRMEEIQRDQEDVRRRFASITYSDPLYWDQPGAAGPQCHAPGSRPASPQPIRLTRPALKQTSAADIVLEKPVETGFPSEDSLTEEVSQDERQPRNSTAFPGPAERGKGTVISVPGSMLRSIRRYREDYEAYLRIVAHEAVGSFNPWAVANSLAEELLAEALADVAAEFQDVVEEYAEAVFTSEFLQPTQSPPAPAAALVSQ
ncbi:protein moonraker isoform X16 [Lates calcarifer]|uniref:Protein moonraker isoform X11 n=1 Tax=Lates calcarifer TaxID=8187 RepID=A0AAJ8AXM5_LATCA|nr:protein moonraker isoform X2 [Lates calcarifer]XP_050921593.1 protein moonraker isoform X6 [Lates calcarifer]XP_050921595.1 protein moonraker isoform X8 [Lates calcarifer]XP_050921598.1 protein moonraker isoform X11 [Lates calcarifer]XP_050921603.1 protein moonraker isoform X15 [Lates calcarifer]XP_050921604.1 protein moonraker isoform X16 [Lates calcarifer]